MNICAHDERLYCAKVGKRRDKGFSELSRALKPVVDHGELRGYVEAVSSLLEDVSRKSPVIAENLIDGMGIREGDLSKYF